MYDVLNIVPIPGGAVREAASLKRSSAPYPGLRVRCPIRPTGATDLVQQAPATNRHSLRHIYAPGRSHATSVAYRRLHRATIGEEAAKFTQRTGAG